MSDIARGQITINSLDSEHTFIKWSDDLKTIKFDNPEYREVAYMRNPYRYYFYIPYSDVGNVSSKTRIVIEFNIQRIPNTSYAPFVFGNYNSKTNRISLQYSHTNRELIARMIASYDDDYPASNEIRIPYTMGTRVKVDMDFNRIIVNDNDIYYWPADCDKTDFSSAYSMRYFNATNGTTVIGNNYYFYGCIYHIQVYYDGVLRGNFIPVVRLNTNHKGVTFYNTILNKVGISWNTAANQYYVYGGEEIGENRILNGNFKKDLQYWNTTKMGDNMTCSIVEDGVKGNCLSFISTDVTTIDASNNTIYQSISGTANNSANRYFDRLDYIFQDNVSASYYQKPIVSFDAKADSEANLKVLRRNDSTIGSQFNVEVGTQWRRYVVEFSDSTAGSVQNTLGFAPSNVDVNYYITNIKVEYGTSATDYSECPDDQSTYQVTGKYMGTLVWDNDYPSENFDDYTWVKV